MPATCPNCRELIAQTNLTKCPKCSSPLRGPEPKLVVRLQGGTSEFPIRSEHVSMGRNPQRNNICISDREVSKEHAVVEKRGNDVVLRDLGSSNGTFVNDRQVQEIKLKDGDNIRLGNTTILFMAGEATPVTQREMPGTTPIQLTTPVNASPSRPNLTVVHSFNAPVLAQIKQSTDRKSIKPVTAISDMEELRSEYKRLQVAAAFQEEVRLETNTDALLEKILNFAHSTLEADNGAILRKVDSDWQTIHVQQRKGANTSFTVSDTLLEQVANTLDSVLITDVDFDPRFSAAQSIVSQGIKCAMGVPLITKGEVRGVLYLDTLQRTHAFSDRDLHLFSGIANQAAIALENAELIKKMAQEAATRANLNRFLSPALVEQAEKGKIDIKRGGQETEVTILFSDIRGFTSMSERQQPEEIVRMLNEYFEEMVDIVFEHKGILDKFIGDALMALWGAPVRRPEDAENAVMAALKMQERVREFNKKRVRENKVPVHIGIGINTGVAVVGNMGSSKRMEYTAIGDAVNLASRLCHEAQKGDIIISSNTLKKLKPNSFEFENLPAVKVKGKEKAIDITKVLAYASDRTAAS